MYRYVHICRWCSVTAPRHPPPCPCGGDLGFRVVGFRSCRVSSLGFSRFLCFAQGFKDFMVRVAGVRVLGFQDFRA